MGGIFHGVSIRVSNVLHNASGAIVETTRLVWHTEYDMPGKAMNNEKPRKRLVSKGQYALYFTKVVALCSASIIMAILGIFICIVSFVGLAFHLIVETSGDSSTAMVAIIAMFCAAVGLAIAFVGKSAVETAFSRIEPVELLTHRSIAELPEEEHLVRSSSVNSLPQETVLLRAARADAKTQEEELLRPTG